MIHELKLFTDYFMAVIEGKKTFEIRKNDRDFHEGDLLALNEYDGHHYTGNSCLVYVDYIMHDPEYVKKDMVVMAIKPCVVMKTIGPYNVCRERIDYSVPLATKREDAE